MAFAGGGAYSKSKINYIVDVDPSHIASVYMKDSRSLNKPELSSFASEHAYTASGRNRAFLFIAGDVSKNEEIIALSKQEYISTKDYRYGINLINNLYEKNEEMVMLLNSLPLSR